MFSYKDGHLFWLKKRNGIKDSLLAGNENATGRWCIKLNGKIYLAHRLIWVLFKGEIPDGYEVDHIDTDPLNNKIENLRLATRPNNQRNRPKGAVNTSGYKGVSYRPDIKKWRARICTDERRITIGNFDTAKEAHEAYKTASMKYHGEFANFG